jgi:hypothetical protein
MFKSVLKEQYFSVTQPIQGKVVKAKNLLCHLPFFAELHKLLYLKQANIRIRVITG